ncbi:Bardet-Biedl syndrome 1 protein homolog isoform X2 [Artemia franciscana]|uniref:Bardet-Biedl syndrome 1 protein homolog isoform X2 n=1 Tax=Artemia franciscana TaxID=6661 RepID=UPI0032D9E6C2
MARGIIVVNKDTAISAKIPGTPSGLVCFSAGVSRSTFAPCIVAVACKDVLYMYKLMKPFFKFKIPAIEIPEHEEEILKKVSQSSSNEEVEEMSRLLLDGSNLSLFAQSLSLANEGDRYAMMTLYKSAPQDSITTLSTLTKNHHQSSLVLTTLSRRVIIVDCETFSVLCQFAVPVVANHVACRGVYESDYKIAFSGKRGQVYTTQNEDLHNSVAYFYEEIKTLAYVDKVLVVSSELEVSGFTSKGKRLWTVPLWTKMLSICTFYPPSSLSPVIAVAIFNSILFYRDGVLVETLLLSEKPKLLTSTRLNTGESALAIVSYDGNISIQIPNRNVTFSSKVNDLFERLDKVNSDVRKQVGNNYKNVTKQFTPRKTDSFIDAEAKVYHTEEGSIVSIRLFNTSSNSSLVQVSIFPDNDVNVHSLIKKEVIVPSGKTKLLTFEFKEINPPEKQAVIAVFTTDNNDSSLHLHKMISTKLIPF